MRILVGLETPCGPVALPSYQALVIKRHKRSYCRQLALQLEVAALTHTCTIPQSPPASQPINQLPSSSYDDDEALTVAAHW